MPITTMEAVRIAAAAGLTVGDVYALRALAETTEEAEAIAAAFSNQTGADERAAAEALAERINNG